MTVFANDERKGCVVHPGMAHENGQPVGRLEGGLRWVVKLGHKDSVAIDGPLPLPPSGMLHAV